MPPPQQRIRLLLAIPHLGGGGAERVIALIAQHLDPACFEIHLLLITADSPGAAPLPSHVTLYRLNLLRVRQAVLPSLRLIHSLRPDVALSGMAHLSFLLLLLKPLFPTRTRLLVRQNTTASSAANHWIARLAYRLLYPRADRIFCQSQPMADDLVQHFKIPAGKLLVLRNPVAPIPLPASPSSPQKLAPQLLFVGRLSSEKGADLLLNALPSILKTHPQTHLTILGIGPEERALRALAERLQIDQSVHFAGHADPAPYYAAASLFILPSRYEGIPNALLEAASTGLPIAATPASAGLVELLQHAPHCHLASSITADGLAGAVLAALANLPLTRVQHTFLGPFQLPNAIAAYAKAIASEARPRLAMLIPTLDRIGGAERQLLDLAHELSKRSWQITVITLSGTASPFDSSAIAHLSLHMRKAWIDPRGWLRYLRWHRQNRPEIFHAHLPHATWFARSLRILALLLLRPAPVLIDTIHTSATGPISRRLAYRLTNRLSAQVTTVSHAVANSVRHAGSAPNPIVLPNGIPIPPLADAHRPAQLPFRWLAIGRLSPVKDYPTLLRAFAQLPGHPTLTVAGAGPDELALRALSAELDIFSRIRFLGFQTQIQPLFAHADAFVLASLWEGLPVSVLEASAAALPVVATDAAGTRETLIPGQTGFLVPIANPEALAAAMTRLQQLPPAQFHTMGLAGRAFVQANFSIEKIADRWEVLYHKLLGR